jgi:hypothetical protein
MEYFSYYPVLKKSKFYPTGNRKYLSIADIRKKLPDEISRQLVQDTPIRSSNCICVETSRNDAVRYLDRVMKIKNNDFAKRRWIEIAENQVENYDYFFLGLRDLDWGKHVEYDVTRPSCAHETCPIGSRRTSPVSVNPRTNLGLSLARISGIWEMSVSFLISRGLKDVFDSNGVTGLAYEPSLINSEGDRKSRPTSLESHFFYAKISNGLAQQAGEIYLHDWCKVHGVIVRFDIVDVCTPRSAILDYDFQMITKVSVKGHEYHYRLPHWIVSRKVLKILLEENVRDLRVITPFLKKPFMPVLLAD